MGTVCEKCPMLASINSALDVINDVNHTDVVRSQGGIELTKLCLEKTVNRLGCDGPVKNSDVQTVCPNTDAVFRTRSFSSGPWRQGDFAVVLENIVKVDINKDSSFGNYI